MKGNEGRKLFKLRRGAKDDIFGFIGVKGKFVIEKPGLDIREAQLEMENVLMNIRREERGEDLCIISIGVMR